MRPVAAAGVIVYRAAGLAPDVRARLVAAAEAGKAVVVEPVGDTIKLAAGDDIAATIDRDGLYWPLAWACLPDRRPSSDPPAAQWFLDAATVVP